MREFLFTLTGLTLGGSAAVCLLALAGRSTRARYGARWRCLAWPSPSHFCLSCKAVP